MALVVTRLTGGNAILAGSPWRMFGEDRPGDPAVLQMLGQTIQAWGDYGLPAAPASRESVGYPAVFADGDVLTTIVNGVACNATIHAQPATVAGAAPPFSGVAANHKLLLFINGDVAPRTVQFLGTEAAPADFINAINAALNPDVVAAGGAGVLTLTTARKGSSASIVVSSLSDGDVLASLGLAGEADVVHASPGPNNVANVGAVTSAELAAIVQPVVAGVAVVTAPDAATVHVETVKRGTAATLELAAGWLGAPAGAVTGDDAVFAPLSALPLRVGPRRAACNRLRVGGGRAGF